jgi:DNA polymerase III epsilon subunit-like protein
MTTIYFDLETGGVVNEPVIQLAAVAVDEKFNEVASFEQKLTFDTLECNAKALEVNGYTPEAWANAVPPAQCIRQFSNWLKPLSTVEMISKRTGQPYMVARLAGYNALSFDLPRLRALYGDQFFPCSYHVRDILQRAMFYFDENPNGKPKDLKLTTMAEHFGIPIDGAHDALFDCRLAVAVHRKMVDL